jgi:hypothetical protein
MLNFLRVSNVLYKNTFIRGAKLKTYIKPIDRLGENSKNKIKKIEISKEVVAKVLDEDKVYIL